MKIFHPTQSTIYRGVIIPPGEPFWVKDKAFARLELIGYRQVEEPPPPPPVVETKELPPLATNPKPKPMPPRKKK